jgi:hypothetical protein
MLSVGAVSASLAWTAWAVATSTPVPTTGAASAVTSTAATLNGVVAPSGSQVAYEFQYGTSTSYTSATVPLVLPPGSTPEHVSTRISVLEARTTYHYRLAISTSATGSGGVYYPVAYAGLDATFQTVKVGSLTLGAAVLPVRAGGAAVPLLCASAAPCRGTLTLVQVLKRTPVTLGSARFSIRAGRRSTVTITLSNLALSGLAAAHPPQLSATLTATASTHQHGFRRTVTLTG